MTLFLSMLPFYILGNLHCIGMCGPLAMMMAKNRWRYAYLIGRIVSFTFAGALAGGIGAVLAATLTRYHIPAAASFLFGSIILAAGLSTLGAIPSIGSSAFAKPFGRLSAALAKLALKEGPLPLFFFGFFTLFLPCGQTMIVFSACALYGGILPGLFNGFAFALITSPSLFLAMHAYSYIQKGRRYANGIMGACAVAVALLAFCRGFADLGYIPHWIINADAPPEYHIVMY